MTLSDLPKVWTTLQNISKFRVSMCLKLIFKVLYFLKMFPIFVGSVHDFGWTMTLFSEKIFISNRCISGLMSNLIKKCWTVSTLNVFVLVLCTGIGNVDCSAFYIHRQIIIRFLLKGTCKHSQPNYLVRTSWFWFLNM